MPNIESTLVLPVFCPDAVDVEVATVGVVFGVDISGSCCLSGPSANDDGNKTEIYFYNSYFNADCYNYSRLKTESYYVIFVVSHNSVLLMWLNDDQTHFKNIIRRIKVLKIIR